MRDPLVGRDILVGVLGACVLADVVAGGFLVKREVIGSALPTSPGRIMGELVAGASDAAMAALMFPFLFVLFWTLFRRRWAGAVLSWAVLAGMVVLLIAEVSTIQLAAAYAAISCAAVMVLLIRFGLTSALVMWATADALLKSPAGLQLSAWYQNPGQVVALVVLLLAVYGFRAALAGRRVFSGDLLGE